jgi:hypothetical protein
MTELLNEIKDNFYLNKKNTGKCILSAGLKNGGKSYLMNQVLRYAFKNKLFDQYVLVLPSYQCEANDSYDFIDEKDPNVLIFTEYSEILPKKIMNYQTKLINKKKDKKKIAFFVDDASGQTVDSIHLDQPLKQLITIIRHMNTVLWLVCHATSGVISKFLRSNLDIMIVYNLSNLMLLESIFDEFLSLNPQFRVEDNNRKNKKRFIDYFLQVMQRDKQGIYFNLRSRYVNPDVYSAANLLC